MFYLVAALLVLLWSSGEIHGLLSYRERENKGTCVFFSFSGCFVKLTLFFGSSVSSCRGISVFQHPSTTQWRLWSTCWCHTSPRNTKTTWTLLVTPTTAWQSSSRLALLRAPLKHLISLFLMFLTLHSALLHLHGQRFCLQADQQLHELLCARRPQGDIFKPFIQTRCESSM